jgi:cyclophilin family peptidyl-prolyl cis-trans isomerase/HEAT repeat protein
VSPLTPRRFGAAPRRLALLAAFAVVATAGTARADDPRATILAVEMARGPADSLRPWLEPGVDPALRRTAVRALGRIGDRGTAPDLLATALTKDAPDLAEALFYAGISEAKRLAPVVREHLASTDPAVRAAAAEALGWVGEPGDIARLSPLLLASDPRVVAGAWMGLARCKAEGYLERAAIHLRTTGDARVRAAAAFAAWRMAAARSEAGKAEDPESRFGIDAVPILAFRLEYENLPPQGQMDRLRPLGLLAPMKFRSGDEPFRDAHWAISKTAEADPRVLQDLLWRWCRDREGEAFESTAILLASHADPKVRALAAEDLGRRGTPNAVEALKTRVRDESDPLVRETLAIAAARAGHDALAQGIVARADRPGDAVVRHLTEVEALAASRRPAALAELVALGRDPGLETAARMTVLERLEGKDDPSIAAFAAAMLGDPDPFVRAQAVSLAGKNGLEDLLDGVIAAYERASSWRERDVRQAAVGAWAAFAKVAGAAPEAAQRCRDAILRAGRDDPSAPVRLAARTAAKGLGLEGLPAEDAGQPNDWRGLPRPAGPILGLDLSGEGEWLSEAEVLRLADRIAETNPRVVFETTQGEFAVEVDAREAPVHSASLLIAAAKGIYDGTRWHRVVPNFVIQGGDPLGHGGGDAGWVVPDEITRLPFVRGALGMPKDTKDTGGCQVFVMHSDYAPLDGRYTCYGRVVSGMEVVDRIRVGDAIVEARIVTDR